MNRKNVFCADFHDSRNIGDGELMKIDQAKYKALSGNKAHNSFGKIQSRRFCKELCGEYGGHSRSGYFRNKYSCAHMKTLYFAPGD